MPENNWLEHAIKRIEGKLDSVECAQQEITGKVQTLTGEVKVFKTDTKWRFKIIGAVSGFVGSIIAFIAKMLFFK